MILKIFINERKDHGLLRKAKDHESGGREDMEGEREV